ncbi:hypothetical protein [Paraburkholderia sp. MM6662-R1]|uniref:hypothetical protein n=1 Tax=Paraburkholderia sp. MM6662-R1 TaxID=2991066 RepID=UPI003D25DC47
MALGPGKYDEFCTDARVRTKAEGAILLILNGSRGSGFSVQADLMTQLRLAEILETMARQIRADLAGAA